MQNNKHSLAIDEAKFKKTSKKIVSKLNEQYSLDIKLNSFHELFAESLGHRNLYALQKVFQEGELVKPNDNVEIFKGLTAGQSTQIFVNLMDDQNSSNMWKSRAISLISTVMMALTYMREQEEDFMNEKSLDPNTKMDYLYFENGLLDVKEIRKYLDLDKFFKLFKTTRHFPEHIRNAMRAYLMSLPGFQESSSKQSDTTKEQHQYLQMQFSDILNKLSFIEKNNFIIAHKNWFDFSIKPSLDFDPTRHKMNYIKKELRDLDCIEISWLDMECYQKWIYKALQKTEVLKISDLLVYTSMIISPQKKAEMCFLLNSILNNLDTASAISKEIQSSI